jgi:hypothetical protein
MNGILLSSMIESIATRADGTVKITIGTQELSQSRAGELFALTRKIAAVYISPKDSIPQKELDQVDKLDPDFTNAKTKSQRLRAVMFRLWEQQPEGFKDFDVFYNSKMEVLIEHFKAKLS